MSKKKMVVLISAGILAVLVIGIACWNAIHLFFLSSDFKQQIKGTDGIQFQQMQSTYGKLVGNGNGIQFFGAALVSAESEEQVRQLVAELDEDFEVVGYREQTNRVISSKYLEHQTLYFTELDVSNGECYQIYFFVSDSPYNNPFDVRGH